MLLGDDMPDAQSTPNRLDWARIALICLSLTALYWSLMAIVKTYAPDYAENTQTLGHIFVTVCAILIIRVWEERYIQQDRDATKLVMQAQFDALISRHYPLALSATNIGLRAIYPTRVQAMEQVQQAIVSANSRIWMLGVAFKETFSIESKIDEITDHLNAHKQIDARILLLNPHTTPAVVRSFLEARTDDAEEVLAEGGRRFVRSALYADIRTACGILNRQEYDQKVRFYRRDPSMWLVIADDRIFVEPYTFGRPPRPSARAAINRRMGGHMPVFEFDGTAGIVGRILEDHFSKLWTISRDSLQDILDLLDNEPKAVQMMDDEVFLIRQGLLTSLLRILKEQGN